MKRLIILLGIIIGSASVSFAQNSMEIIDKYKGQEGVSYISINKYLFSMFSDVDTEDAESQEFLDVVKTLDGMKILTTEDEKIGKDLYSKVSSYLNKNSFEELMRIEEKGKTVVFSIREEGKKVSELIMLVKEENDVVVMSIVGDIDLKKISKLSKKMNIEGLENLDEIDENK